MKKIEKLIQNRNLDELDNIYSIDIETPSNFLDYLHTLALFVMFTLLRIFVNISLLFCSIYWDIELLFNILVKKYISKNYKKYIINKLNKHCENISKDGTLYLGTYNDIIGRYTIIHYLEQLNVKPINYKDFIKNFILIYRDCYITFSDGGKERGLYNFTDTRRRRSLGDIYLVTKTYFPDVKIQDVVKVLVDLCEKDIIKASYCTTINKYVFHTDSDRYINGRLEWLDNGKWFDVVKEFKDE